jgi:methylenetetrahydrofolate dehydrogenase (NADP+)/methenyltetrahydrofolate cyclohydrolase
MEVINGSDIAAEIRQQLKEENLREGISPLLAIIVVGDDKESLVYVGLKTSAVEATGGKNRLLQLDADIDREALLQKIENLNQDETVDGILLQLPLPQHLELYRDEFLKAIDPEKDVDGFNPENMGRLICGKPAFISCAALACMDIIRRAEFLASGKNAVLIGDSFDLIIPLAILLLKEGLKVTMIPEYEEEMSRGADILVVEKGLPQMVRGESLAEGSLVIDAGFHWHAGRSCGNVDKNSLVERELYLLPVPGGLGPVLIAKLMENLSIAARKNQLPRSQEGSIGKESL